eukprot:gene5823-8914_t
MPLPRGSGGGALWTAIVLCALTVRVEAQTITPSRCASGETTEAGGACEVEIVLSGPPVPGNDVQLTFHLDDTSEASLSSTGLTFATATWDTPQTITVTGAQDAVDDGDVGYLLIFDTVTSADPAWVGAALPADLSFTNIDDDVSAVSVTPTTLQVNESGTTAEYTVLLTTQPTSNVTITVNIGAGDADEVTFSPVELVFTPGTTGSGQNQWGVAQTVTVTGIDDNAVDGDQVFALTHTVTTADVGYTGVTPASVSVTNLDNDAGSVTLTSSGTLVTYESGASSPTYTIHLETEPSGDVVISITSNATDEATNDPDTLVFSPLNYTTPRTVTVSGVDDNIADGSQPFKMTHTATSGDATYDGIVIAEITGVTMDDDVVGIFVNKSAALETDESGLEAFFTVYLQSEPTDPVDITFASDDATEAAVPGPGLTFSPGNWDVPQTVTVRGADDDIADGAKPFAVSVSGVVSSDAQYAGLALMIGTAQYRVDGSNADDDAAAIIVVGAALATAESGTAATFEVTLQTEPENEVTLSVLSSDVTEAVVNPSSLSFLPTTWSIPQTVTVTGVDDDEADGDTAYSVLVGAPITTTDPVYGSLSLQQVVAGSNTDDDSPSITVAPTAVSTTEGGGQGEFTVTLGSKPANDVTITFTSNNTAEGTVNVNQYTFTPAQWDTPHTVTVTGVQDAIADGDVAYLITSSVSSSDASYSSFIVVDVSVTNVDDDVASVVVDTPRAPSTLVLSTTEAGGTDTFTIVLGSQPRGTVTVNVTSSNTDEATVSPSLLTFTSGGAQQWSKLQTVVVTGADDLQQDGNASYTITAVFASADPEYDSISRALTGSNTDDDVAGITVAPAGAVWNMVVAESGTTAFFVARLDTMPLADVTVFFTGNDSSEALVTPAGGLVFTTADWQTPKTVTITGQDDFLDDGDTKFVVTSLAASGDSAYDGLAGQDAIEVVTLDDDTSSVSFTPASGLTTSEAGLVDTFTAVLTAEPVGDVVVSFSVADASEGQLSAASFTFTTTSWDTPQTATVSAFDDDVADGNVTYSINSSVDSLADENYDGLIPPGISVTNIDDDVAGIVVMLSPATGLVTSEDRDNATFEMYLTSEPLFEVTVGIASTDATEGSVFPASLVFNATQWNVAQTVTVYGLDDDLADGDVQFSILTGTASSLDAAYGGVVDPADPPVVNTDNDAPGIVVGDAAGAALTGPLQTSEAGGPAVFTVVLASRPSASVQLDFVVRDTSEGSLSTDLLTFEPSAWNVPQSVTVTGVQDAVADGDVTYDIAVSVTTSDTTGYALLVLSPVQVQNTDDDTPGIAVSAAGAALATSEAGGFAAFTVVLRTQPTAEVTVSINTSNALEGAVTPSTLTFLPGPCTASCDGRSVWSSALTVTLTGVDDQVADGNVTYAVQFAPSVSADAQYDGVILPDITAENTDDDVAGILVIASSTSFASTKESDTTTPFPFTVRLATRPQNQVAVSVEGVDVTEGVVSPSSLTFDAGDWNVTQTVTLTALDDDYVDGDVGFALFCQSASADAAYDTLRSGNITVVNQDDDVAGIELLPTAAGAASLATGEDGGSDSFTVRLLSMPLPSDPSQPSTVEITLGSSNAAEGTLSVETVTLDDTTWNTGTVVTVTGVDDLVVDGDVQYTVSVVSVASGDPAYQNQTTPPSLQCSNADDDAVGVYIIVAGTSYLSGTVPTQLTTTEDGTAPPESIGVRLRSQPRLPVTVQFGSTDSTEGSVSPPSVLFTAADWDVEQTVAVSGVDDDLDDGDEAYSIVASVQSGDTAYDGLAAAQVLATNIDNDDSQGTVCVWSRKVNETRVGTTCTCCSAETSEDGVTIAEISVVLSAQPSDDVVIPVFSSDASEGLVSATSLTFTSRNWNTAQTLTVTGEQDAIDDDDVAYSVILNPATSADPAFNGLDLSDVSVVNTDDDEMGVTISPQEIAIDETGAAVQFSVVLHTQPAAEVVVQLAESPHVTLSSNRLVFTPGSTAAGRAGEVLQSGRIDWATPHVVTVTPVQDFVARGLVTFTLAAQFSSADAKYDSFVVASPLEVTKTDDDVAGLVVSSNTVVSPDPSSPGTFTVALSSEPLSDVTIQLASSDGAQGTVSPAALTFTAANWRDPQTVTVTSSDLAGGFTVVADSSSSADATYAGNITLPTIAVVASVATDSPTEVCEYTDLTLPAGSSGCPTVGTALPSATCTPVVGGVTCSTTTCTATGDWSDVSPFCPTSAPPGSSCDGFAPLCTLDPSAGGCTADCTMEVCCLSCALFSCPSSQAVVRTNYCAPAGCTVDVCCTPVATQPPDTPTPAVPATTAPTEPRAAAEGDDAFPSWAIAAIVGGVLLLCLLVLVAAFCCWRGARAKEAARRKNKDLQETEALGNAAKTAPPPLPLYRNEEKSLFLDTIGSQRYASVLPSQQMMAVYAPEREEMVEDLSARGERYVARWSNTRRQYYYYPELTGAGSSATAQWEIPKDGYVVAWTGGPDDFTGAAASPLNPQFSSAVEHPGQQDLYSVTPLPTAVGTENPLNALPATNIRD